MAFVATIFVNSEGRMISRKEVAFVVCYIFHLYIPSTPLSTHPVHPKLTESAVRQHIANLFEWLLRYRWMYALCLQRNTFLFDCLLLNVVFIMTSFSSVWFL